MKYQDWKAQYYRVRVQHQDGVVQAPPRWFGDTVAICPVLKRDGTPATSGFRFVHIATGAWLGEKVPVRVAWAYRVRVDAAVATDVEAGETEAYPKATEVLAAMFEAYQRELASRPSAKPKIKISLENGEQVTVVAEWKGKHCAVTPSNGGWTITHLKTGLAIGPIIGYDLAMDYGSKVDAALEEDGPGSKTLAQTKSVVRQLTQARQQ